MKKSQKRRMYIILVVVVVIIAGLMAANRIPSPFAKSTPTPKTAAKKPAGATGSAYQTEVYSQLVNEYADRRIQFDDSCQAKPANTTFKVGIKIMFDNRSAQPRTIKIGNITYSFTPYGYRILTLSSQNLPDALSINCDSSVNVGRILLQAQISNAL